MKTRLVLFVIAVVLAGRSYGTSSYSYGPKYLNPTDEVVTPHIAWAKPSVQRPLKALFVTHRRAMREAVEISQRMDLEYTVFAMQYQDNRIAPSQEDPFLPIESAPKAIMAEGLRKLDGNYDVIVLGSIDWGNLPLVFQYKILQKVKAGAGLVGLVTGPDEYLKRATAKKAAIDGAFLVPYKGLPAFAGYKDYDQFLNATLDVSEFGKGRICLFKGYKAPIYRELTPEMTMVDTLDPKLVEYDYYLAYVIHALNVAAGRQAAVRIRGPSGACVNREDASAVEFSLETDAPGNVVCRMVLRNGDNEEVKVVENKPALTAGKTVVSLPLKGIPAGEYFADLWIMQDKKIVEFGSTYVLVQSRENIEKIDLKKSWRCEEGVHGTITVKLDSGAAMLRIWQEDTLGRITAKTEVKADGGSLREIAFALPATQPLTIVQYLKAALCRGEEVVDLKKTPLSFENLYPKDDLRYIVSCCYLKADYLAYWYCAEMCKAGFDTLYYEDHMDRSNEIISWANLRLIPYATRIIDTKTDHYGPTTRSNDDHIRAPCLNDPAYRQQEEAKLAKAAVRLKPYSTYEFSMGDECYFAEIHSDTTYELCFCSNCVSGFHGFLKREYKDVAGLNQEYESTYNDFDEVRPVTLAEVRKDDKLRPLWVDYRRYMEDTWVDIYRFGRDVIQKIIPGAKVGYEGSDKVIGNSFKARDFYKLMQVLRLNCPYEGYFQPYCFKDFCQPGTLLGAGWDGGYNAGFRSVEYQRYIGWKHIFQGVNSLWEFNGDPTVLEGITAPDFSFYDFFKAKLAEVRELKSGVGKLMMNTVREHDGIAILYPGSSVHASTLSGGFPFIEKELNGWVALLLKTHRQFKFISYAELAAGIMKKETFTTLILPFSQAMSKEEVAETVGFVKAGGTVIADLRPGVCDEHGKPYKVSPLDEVFGVRQAPRVERPARGVVLIHAEGFPTNMPETIADSALDVVSGKACAEVKQHPALIVNQYDRGRAILLNFGIGDYLVKALDKSSIMTETTPLLKPFGEALFALAGHVPRIRINPDMDDLLVYGFKSGELSYYGLLEELPEPLLNYQNQTDQPLKARKVTVKLDGPGHVYNIRRGKYVGYASEFETSVKPGVAQLYSRLPYYVSKLDLRTPWIVSQGDVLRYTLQLKVKGSSTPGRHIFHIMLIGPDGEERSYYADNVMAENGEVNGEIPLAWNESTGLWTMKVRDIASGVRDKSWFFVRKARK